jgi:hypothetical protein
VNNQATISISNNLVFHDKTKHFKIKFFFLKEGEMKLFQCKTEEQSVYILTKALFKFRFEHLRQKLRVCNFRVKKENC